MAYHATLGICIQEIICAFPSVHPHLYSYPVVFLESLSAVGTTFASLLRCVLRIEVKQPISHGNLG